MTTETYYDKHLGQWEFILNAAGQPVEVWKDCYKVKNCNKETAAILLEKARKGELVGTPPVLESEEEFDNF